MASQRSPALQSAARMRHTGGIDVNPGGFHQTGNVILALLAAVAVSGFPFSALAADTSPPSAGSAASAESAPVLPAPLTAPAPSAPSGAAAPAPAALPPASAPVAVPSAAAPATSGSTVPALPLPLTAPGPSVPSNASAPVTPGGSATSAALPRPRPTVRHRVTIRAEEVEPAQGRLKLNSDSPVLSAPAQGSRSVAQVHATKYVIVTGLTANYVRVQLRDGTVGYVPNEAVDLVKPADKVFSVIHNSPVYEKPSRYSRQVAEVHTPGRVQVTGIAPNYMKVRMRSGVEGFVPENAFE